MFTFVFQANRETMRDFNARLREYCADKPVVSIEATTIGANLVLQGTTADDMDADEVPTFTAVVDSVDPLANNIEEHLDGMIEKEYAQHSPDTLDGELNLPVKFIIIPGTKKYWVVLLCINGMAEDDPGDEGDDRDDSTEPSEPQPVPAAGFQGG